MTTDETLVHQFQPEMKLELWKGSLLYKKAKTVMSAGKVTVYISQDAKRVLLLDYLKRVTLSITRVSIDKKGALQPEHCSGTQVHSAQAWLLGVFQLVKHHS